MSDKNSFEEIFEHAEAYATTKIEITKLNAIEKGSRLGGSLVAALFFLAVAVSVFGLLSISGAFALTQWLGNTALGFLVMGGLYAVIGLLFYINRKRWIHRPIANAIIKTVLNETSYDK